MTYNMMHCLRSTPFAAKTMMQLPVNLSLVTRGSTYIFQCATKQKNVLYNSMRQSSDAVLGNKSQLTKSGVISKRLFSFLQPNKWKVGCNGRTLSSLRTLGRIGALPSFSLALFPWRNHSKENKHEFSEEILSHIPKEVFTKDILQKKVKRNALSRFTRAVWEMLRIMVRFTRILLTFGPIITLYPLTYLSGWFTTLWWHMLLAACEWTGPTFIKLGQWASTRRDLFSAEFCDLFSKLHSTTRRHSWFVTKKKLQKAFGAKWRQIFIKMDRNPIGSGCIAQVHKAYMTPDMIPDESVVEEFRDDFDESEPEIDFLEGLELFGYGHIDSMAPDEPEVKVPKRPKGSPETEAELQALPPRLQPRKPDLSKITPPPKVIREAEKTENEDDSEDPKEKGSSWIQTQPDPNETSDTTDDEDLEDIPLIPVAVKVLHPGVYKSVCRDLKILKFCTRFIQFLFPSLKWLSLEESLEEFRFIMIQQVDLRFEANCLETLVENFEDDPHIRFPMPIRPYCKRDVLVETFEEGEPVSNFIHNDRECPEEMKGKLAELGADAILKMVFIDDFVHGDLHPGNILVQNADNFSPQDENKVMLLDVGDTLIVSVKQKESPLRLVMLDAGISIHMNDKDLDNFRAVMKSVVLGEGEKVAELMLAHARFNECKNVTAFKKELGDLVMKARANTIQLGKLKMGELLSNVFAILIKHKVKMESNFASVLIAIFVLEGLGRSLDPTLDLLERARPVLLKNT